MKLFRNATYACTLVLFFFQTQAQQYALKQSTAKVKGPQQVLLPAPQGDYITITYPFIQDHNPVIISRFDHTLNQKYTNPIAALKKERYESCLYNNGHLTLFCSTRDGAVSRYDVDDQTGALTGSPTSLFNLDAWEVNANWYTGSAPGKNFNYFAAREHRKKEKGSYFHGVIMDQLYGKLADFNFVTPEDAEKVNQVYFLQSDDGTLYVIYSVNVKTDKENYTPQTFKVTMIDTKGAIRNFPLNGLPKGNLGNLSWNIDGTRLSFVGLISHEKNKGYTTAFTGSLDFQKKKGSFHQTELSTLMTNTPDFLQGYKENGLPAGITLRRTIHLSDGSRILLFENEGSDFYQSHYAPMSPSNPGYSSAPMSLQMGTMSSYSITYYNRGNIFLLKTDANNIPQWLDVVTKNQREADMAIAVGTGCTLDSKDNIHLFFMDRKKNTEPDRKSPEEVNGLHYKDNYLACVTVTPSGTMTKQFIDQDQPRYRPMLEKSIGDAPDELIFLAMKKKLAFTEEHILNHGDFHLATIRINTGQPAAMANN